MTSSRLSQRSQLVYKVGLVVAPVKLAKVKTSEEKSTIAAKFNVESEDLSNEINAFSKPPRAEYKKEWGDFANAWRDLNNHISALLHDATSDWDKLDNLAVAAVEAICKIPASLDERVFERGSPFSAHCQLRDLISTAVEEVVYTDRYLDASIFYRYLQHVPDETKISLVTDNYVLKNKDQEVFKDASRMFAKERPNYLISTNDLHDRWLRIDGQMYHLGGSIKHAAVYDDFTIAELTSVDSKRKLDKCVSESTPWSEAMSDKK